MSDETTTMLPPSVFARFFTHVFDMPRWHKLVLTIAGLLGAAGITGKVSDFMSGSSPQPSSGQVATRDGTSNGAVMQDRSDSSAADAPQPEQSFLVKHAPWMTKVGVTFIACFVLGWIFRVFVRIMASITALAAMVFFALSYFGVTNVDLTSVHEKYDNTMHWVSDQAWRAKDVALSHLPSGFSSFGGFFVGFRKHRRAE